MEIEGFPNYFIYPDGRIWSNYGKGKFMKHAVDKDGYHKVGLCQDGKQKRFSVHRLVAQAFIPNPDNKPEVDHINQDRSDNRLENLRWVTALENGQNKGNYNTNTSGHKNIYYHKSRDIWSLDKNINKKRYTKYFRTKIDAIVYKFCFLLLNQQRKRREYASRR